MQSKSKTTTITKRRKLKRVRLELKNKLNSRRNAIYKQENLTKTTKIPASFLSV